MKTRKISHLLSVIAFAAACGLSPMLHAAPNIPSAGAVQNTVPVVNVNTATETELAFLPGIGPSRASAIVAQRQRAPFKKVEDLLRIKGIGRKSLDKLRPHVTLDGPTTATSPIRGN